MASDNTEGEEAFSEGFHGLPSEKERGAMSVLRLAELLSTQKLGSIAYIVLEHELNLKIAKVQAKATLSSGWLGLVGSISAALLGVALGYFLSTVLAKYESKSQPAAESSQEESTIPIQQPSISTKLPPQKLLMPGEKPADVRPSNSEGQTKQHNGNTKP